MKVVLVAGVVVLLLSGCATKLSTLPDRQRTAADEALMGAPYSLPMLQYNVTLTRSLRSCPELSTPLPFPGQARAVFSGELAFAVAAEAKEGWTPGERYVVDYEGLRNRFATSDFTIKTYPLGYLKSVNVSADDQTADVVKSVVGAGLSIASLAGGGVKLPTFSAQDAPATLDARDGRKTPNPLQPALKALEAQLQPARLVTCTPGTLERVNKIIANGAAQDTVAGQLRLRTQDVQRLTVIANLRRTEPNAARDLSRALAEQSTLAAQLEELKAAGAKLSGKLAAPDKWSWPGSIDQRVTTWVPQPESDAAMTALLDAAPRNGFVLPKKNFEAWWTALPKATQQRLAAHKVWGPFVKAAQAAPEPTTPPAGCAGAGADRAACLAAHLSVWASLRAAEDGAGPCGKDADGACLRTASVVQEEDLKSGDKRPETLGRKAFDSVRDQGLFVRQPARGVFLVCRSASPPASDATDEARGVCPRKLRIYESDRVSAPQLGQLRFLPLRNRTFEASTLALELREDGSVESFQYKRTRAAGTVAAAAVQDAISQYKTFRETQDTKAKSALKAAREEQIAQVQFEIDTLKKQKELVAAQSPDPENPLQAVKDETTRIETETALLAAKLASLKAEAALAAATGADN